MFGLFNSSGQKEFGSKYRLGLDPRLRGDDVNIYD